MVEDQHSETPEAPTATEYYFGQSIDWKSDAVPVQLLVELPFYLLVDRATLHVSLNGCTFKIEIHDGFLELYVNAVSPSRHSCAYIGPDPSKVHPEIKRHIDSLNVPALSKLCRTYIRVHTRCNSDVVAGASSEGRKGNEALSFMQSFCSSHLAILNRLIRQYRLLTYDFFAYELSPWDVPIWFVETETGFIRINLLDYANWDHRPLMYKSDDERGQALTLVEPQELEESLAIEPSAGELELMDALNLMERGDYSSAVRRVTTAIEAIVRSRLEDELAKRFPPSEVELRLSRTDNDFPGRLRQYEKLSGRCMAVSLVAELKEIRRIRHAIVHRAERIDYAGRGRAQRAVDTGRWIYDFLEHSPDRTGAQQQPRCSLDRAALGPIYGRDYTCWCGGDKPKRARPKLGRTALSHCRRPFRARATGVIVASEESATPATRWGKMGAVRGRATSRCQKVAGRWRTGGDSNCTFGSGRLEDRRSCTPNPISNSATSPPEILLQYQWPKAVDQKREVNRFGEFPPGENQFPPMRRKRG